MTKMLCRFCGEEMVALATERCPRGITLSLHPHGHEECKECGGSACVWEKKPGEKKDAR